MYSSGGPPIAYTPTLYFGNLNTFTQTSGNLAPSGLTVFTGKAKTPYTMNFSFGVQHLFREMSVDISYVGGLSRHLWINRNINPIPIGARFDPKNLDPTTGIALPDNFLRPYRGYGDIILQEFAGTSNYNSLQVKVERRYRQGLQYGVAYTFSKALGVQSSEYDAVSPYFNPRRWNYGPLAQDRTHALVINYSYDLPKVGARLNSKPLGWITDNWTISGITSFVSGAPFMPSLGTTDYEDITGSSESARVTVIGDPKSGPRHFNVAAFGRTPKGSFGNASPGMLRGPGINNWDIALAKRILLFSETRYIQFRTETFNAFNHTQYSAIDGSLLFDKSGKQVNPTAGTYTNARSPRIIEFSLKLVF